MRKQRIKVAPRFTESGHGNVGEEVFMDYYQVPCSNDGFALESRVMQNEMSIKQLASDMSSVESSFQSVGSDLDGIEYQIQDHDRRLMSIEIGSNNNVEMASLSSRVGSAETRIVEANTRLSILESDRNNGSSSNNGHLDLSPITNRLGVAESNITTNTSKISDHDSRIKELEVTSGVADLKPITDKVSKLENEVLTIGAESNSNTLRIASLEAINGGSVDIEEIKRKIDAVETASANNSTVIDAVQRSLETNTGTITDHENRIDLLERSTGEDALDLSVVNATLEAHEVDIKTLEMKVEILQDGGIGGGGGDVGDLTEIVTDIAMLKREDLDIKADVQRNTIDIENLKETGAGYDDTVIRRMIDDVDTKANDNTLAIAALDTKVDNLEVGGGGGGATTFRALTDTPDSYAGQGGRFVAVNGGGTGLEFVNAPAGGGGGDYDDTALRAMITDLDNTKAESTTVTAMDTRLTQAENAIDALEAGGGGGTPGGGDYDDTELRGLIEDNTTQIAIVDTIVTGTVWGNEALNDRLEVVEAAVEGGGPGGGEGGAITSATLQYPWVATEGNNVAADTTKLETNSVLNCGTSGHNITLPKVSDVPDQVIRYITTQHDCTITCHDGDTIWMPRPGSDATSVNLKAGECIALVSYRLYDGWGRLFHVKA